MDTSKKYIKMCEKAVEVQKLWIPKRGDFIVEPAKKDSALIISASLNRMFPMDIWLPRQDQLQEICPYKYPEYVFRFYDFLQKEFIYKDEWICLDSFSMEQLWLAFVMKEKWNKIWDGQNWVKL